MNVERLTDTAALNESGDVVPLDDVFETNSTDTPEYEMLPLFDEIRPSEIGLAAVASLETRRPKELTYPRTVHDAIARIADKREAEDDHTSAYAELGGGLEAKPREPLEESLDAYQPWHKETQQAVEQFGVLDLARGGFDAFKKADRQRFALHFYGFLNTIASHQRAVADAARDGVVSAELKYRYGDRTPQELGAYESVLASLRKDLEATGLPQQVCHELGISRLDNLSEFDKKRRREQLDKMGQDKRRRGKVRVIFENGKPHLKRFFGEVSIAG